MEAVSSLLHRYFRLFDEYNQNESVLNDILNLFQTDATWESDLLGIANGTDEVKAMINDQLALPFISQVRHVSQGHDIVINGKEATVFSYVVVYHKCTPIILTQIEDHVIQDTTTGTWTFQKRVFTDLQKNFEVMAEMQLKGKKRYSSSALKE